MKFSSFIYFAKYGIKSIFSRDNGPIVGTIILTDKCNLKCKHCSVNNKECLIYPYENIKEEMHIIYNMGVRILFFCGGETFLWEDKGKSLSNIIDEAKNIGFLIVNVVTNGTYQLDLPNADLILVSLDGDRLHHNSIRGDTYDLIIDNIKNSKSNNICFYMAINQINKSSIEDVCKIAKELDNVRAVSFNFHTPYPDTSYLSLSKEEKTDACNRIAKMMDEGVPIFNLKRTFPYLINGNFPRPCKNCIVIENGKISTCGRCVEIENLCNNCGYFFVAEYGLIFKGNIKVIIEMLRTYLKYV